MIVYYYYLGPYWAFWSFMSFKKLLYSVGINDADYDLFWRIDGKRFYCPIYDRWHGMLRRCYSPAWQLRHPSYIGCTVDERWHSFMAFREWVLSQPEWEGLHLDKDLLSPGNKVYSPDTCLFVSQAVNKFLTFQKSTPTLYPPGIYTIPSGKYIVKIGRGDGTQWHSRVVDDLDTAVAIYNAKKLEFAQHLGSIQTDPRVASALLKYFDQA